MTYIKTNDDSAPTGEDYIMVPMRVPCNRMQVSDGYHTFEELYQHCDALFARLCTERPESTFKTEVYDASGYANYWVSTSFPKGRVNRTLPVELWEKLDVGIMHAASVYTYNDQIVECLLGQPMPALKPNTECLPHVITLPASVRLGGPGSHYLEVPCFIGQVSDGTNTFDDLYAMRHVLFVALCHEMVHKGAWKSLVHEDSTSFDGYFIAGLELPQGMITYHLPMELWDMLQVETLDKGRPWDGHTAADVVNRLLEGL